MPFGAIRRSRTVPQRPRDGLTMSSGLSGRRSARRVPGESFVAEIEGIDGSVSIINLSRMGVALESETPLETGRRLTIAITGPAGLEIVDFYVVRCERRESDGTYLSAGLFVEKLRRLDLPKVIHGAISS